jgi:hypothetical protein
MEIVTTTRPGVARSSGAHSTLVTYSRAEHRVPQFQRLIPERGVPFFPGAGIEPFVSAPGVVDKEVQPTGLRLDAAYHGAGLLIVAVVADRGDTLTASLRHRIGRLLDGTRQV